MDQNIFSAVPFIPGIPPAQPELLSHYLPPIPDGIISTWLRNNIPAGSWILDPFGASPRLAVEAARAGYRLLVTANNPITRFLLEMMADPPPKDEMKVALAELAASYAGNERIEPHIRALYNTYCARCGQPVSADAFLWEHDNPTPYARIYTCPSCGDSGEHPCIPHDAAQSSKFSGSGLHRARALERVVAFNDQDRIHVEQALSVYNPRALYALITVINKLQGLNISSKGHKYLSALLLYTFDQAHSMWRPQAQSDRRRQLTIPRHARENNIWKALEDGIEKWSVSTSTGEKQSIVVTNWPVLPPTTGGLCIYEGRLAGLIDSIKGIEIRSVCTAIPRPNQAFWTLSALWAGWLWGREAVVSIKSVLHRQRYDWAWHATALGSVFRHLANFLEPSTPILGLIGEAEPGFIGSALVAAGVAGCDLEGMAIRPDENQAQIIWRSKKSSELTQIGTSLMQAAVQSARQYLEANAEPASYLSTIAAAMIGIVSFWSSMAKGQTDQSVSQEKSQSVIPQLGPPSEPSPSLYYSSIYNAAREALSYRTGFLRYNLQDETDIQTAAKGINAQSSLFSLDVGRITTNEDEEILPEPPSGESETTAEKERPTRSSDVTESTLLWLREIGPLNPKTSSDKCEAFLVDYLFAHPNLTLLDFQQAICEEFPGLFTPDSEFIQLCMESYAVQDPEYPNRWRLRQEDNPIDRQMDIAAINRLIHQIGARLGFTSSDLVTSFSVPYISWHDKTSDQDYWFFVTTSAAIGEIVIHGQQPPNKGFIVFPGSRANLLLYKLRRDPRLSRAFNSSLGLWRFLKFRHLRSLSESPLLNRDNMDQMFGLDPLTFSTPQLWLI